MVAFGDRQAGVFCFSGDGLGAQFTQGDEERSTAREDDGPFEKVLKLTDVSRSVPTRERCHGFLRDSVDDFSQAPAVFRDKVPHKQRDVSGSFAKRRSENGQYLEAIKQIAPELFLLDPLSQFSVGGRDQANVVGDRPVSAKALDFALLERAQDLRLEIERQLADFIEKERTFMRQFQAADFARNGSGEGAFFVTKELAFQQTCRDGGAIQFDKCPVAARTETMDGSGQQFFASAGFALNQNCCVSGCDGFNVPENFV